MCQISPSFDATEKPVWVTLSGPSCQKFLQKYFTFIDYTKILSTTPNFSLLRRVSKTSVGVKFSTFEVILWFSGPICINMQDFINFEILKISNLRVPPSLDKSVVVFLTPTGPNLFRPNPSSNLSKALPQRSF